MPTAKNQRFFRFAIGKQIFFLNFLAIMMLLLVLPFVIPANSETRTDYYLDSGSGYRIADSIETSGTEYAIDGTEEVNDVLLTAEGWTAGTSMKYQNVETTTGSIGINASRNGADVEAYIDTYDNATFTGACEYDVYVASGHSSDTYVVFQFNTESGANHLRVGYNEGSNDVNWSCDSACDNDIEFTKDTWNHVYYNWTGTSVMVWVNGALLDTLAETGLAKIRPATQSADVTAYYDDIVCYDGDDRPQDAPAVDTTNPTIEKFSINDTSVKADEDVLVSALLEDETGLDTWRITHNITGTMTNQTLNDISETSHNATYNFTDSLAKHTVTAYQFWTNDTSNNINISDVLIFAVENSLPSVPTIIYPTADLRTNEQPLNLQVTFPADNDSDTLTIYYYINETLNSSSVNNVTFEASDGYYKLEVSITDGEEFSANATLDFEIDTVLPILTVTNPIATTYDANFSINVSCTDTNPFILNYTVFNSTNEIIKSAQDNTPVGNLLEIDDTINVDIIADGSYIANFSCSDSHTKIEIDNYFISYESNGIMYDTAEGNRIKIMQVGKPATPSTSKRTDRYEFYFGTSEEQEIRTYKVISTWNDITIIEDSDYLAHLVVWNGNGGNWIDFVSSDAEIIGISRINPRHIEVFVRATDFNFASIGGLNVVSESISLTIDRAVAEEEAEEEDAVLTIVVLIGSVAIIIAVLIITFMDIRGKKIK